MARKIVIGTRASLLAVAQAEYTKKKLEELDSSLDIELKKIVTSGDKDQRTNWNKDNKSLKDMFVKEIERALLDKEIQIAVHSMKDMPAIHPKGLVTGAIPEREDNRDVLISKNNLKLMDLPSGSIIGTSSLRRVEAIKALRPDLVVEPIRGNIHTRIGKLETENFDGIILAYAGLKRVGLENKITEIFPYSSVMPAPGQGALCIQCNEEDQETLELLKKINHEETAIIIQGEREFSKIFGGGCTTPMGCVGKIDKDNYSLIGMYCHNGEIYSGEAIGRKEEPRKVAKQLGEIIRRKVNG